MRGLSFLLQPQALQARATGGRKPLSLNYGEAYAGRNPSGHRRRDMWECHWGRRLHRVSLKDEWDRLDPETRNWLLENPGCVILPRTMSEKIDQDAAGDIERDQHGQIVLSRDDHDFIRDKAEAAGTIHPRAGTEHRL